MNEWKEYILEDIIDKFIDYRGKTPNKTTIGHSINYCQGCKRW